MPIQAETVEYNRRMGLEWEYERRGAGELVQGGANLYSPTGCCAMAFLTYDVRFGDTKLYPLEALKVGVGAPVTKPRTALGAAHAAADKVSHGNNVISRKNETWPWPNTLNAPRILYTTCTDQYPNFEPDWTLKPYRICTITLTPNPLTP